MAITDKEQGVWELDEAYNKQMAGYWSYDGLTGYFGMGSNSYGTLGLNSRQGRSSPTQLTGTWSKISAAGSSRSFFGLKTDGTAWAWGNSSAYGILGLNNNISRSSPTQLPGTTWGSQFTCDDTSSFWIKTDGTLWAWGGDTYGMLGLNQGPTAKKSSPTQIGTNTTWSSVVTGSGSANALKTDGTLWAWGRNYAGELGLNQKASPFLHGISSPTQIPGTTWKTLGKAASTSIATKTDGTLWMWGNDQFGKLGQNTNGVQRSSPIQVGTNTTWDKVCYSPSHILAIKTDNTLWSWGYNQYGPLGQNQAKAQLYAISSPIQIPGTNWSQIAGGYLTSSATKTDGTLWTWGENEGGQLGLNDQGGAPGYGTSRSSPTQVPGTGWSDPAATRQEFYIKNLL
tara:strand:+ start:23 stop:1216 length:1194 start_codon:yes stop_codon:yes gene_type:complete